MRLATRSRTVAVAALLGATATAGTALAVSSTLEPSSGTPRTAVSAPGSSAAATGSVTGGSRGTVTARATMVRADGSRVVHSASEHAAVLSRSKAPAAAAAPTSATGLRSGATGRDQRPSGPADVTIRAGRGTGTPAAGPSAMIQRKPAPRRVTADDVIRLARAQLGLRENKAGGGTKFHAWYMGSRRAQQTAARDGGKPAHYRNAPWCDIFVSWLADRTGATASMGSDAFTPEHAKWFQRRKRWGHQPKIGSLAFFDWNAKNSRDADTIDHVALVVAKNRDGTIKTIDGNIRDEVVIKNRSLSSVVGFGYPDFAR